MRLPPRDLLPVVYARTSKPRRAKPGNRLLPLVLKFSRNKTGHRIARTGRHQPIQDGSIMIKELVKDEAILSQVCEQATAEDAETAQDLMDTLTSLEGAACLAANQIGVTKCIVAYLDDKEQPHVLFNPTIKLALGAFKTVEGCLSLEADSKVTRFERIKVAYDELVDGALVPRKKDFNGWTAEIIQHTIDHCKGKLV